MQNPSLPAYNSRARAPPAIGFEVSNSCSNKFSSFIITRPQRGNLSVYLWGYVEQGRKLLSFTELGSPSQNNINAARCADCCGGRSVQRAALTKNRLRTGGQPSRAMLQKPQHAPNGIDDEPRPGDRPEEANRTTQPMVSGFPTVHAVGELEREQGRHQIICGIIAR